MKKIIIFFFLLTVAIQAQFIGTRDSIGTLYERYATPHQIRTMINDINLDNLFNLETNTLDDIITGITNVHLTSTLKSNYDAAYSHVSLTNNPHSVTPTQLGLVIGTDVQAYDADLTTYAGITPSANVQTLLGSADFSAFKTSLDLNNLTNKLQVEEEDSNTVYTTPTYIENNYANKSRWNIPRKGYGLDGSNDRITFTTLPYSANGTFEFIFQTGNDVTRAQYVLGGGSPRTNLKIQSGNFTVILGDIIEINAGTVTTDTKYRVVVTWTDGTPTGNGLANVYVNGVQTATNESYTGFTSFPSNVYIGYAPISYLLANIISFNYYNYVLPLSTIKEGDNNDYYNTISVPYSDIGASQTPRYVSDFSGGLDGFGVSSGIGSSEDGISDGVTSYDDVLKFYAFSDDSYHFAYRSSFTGTTNGKRYRLTFKYYIPSANTNVNGLKLTYGGSPSNILLTESTTGTWTEVTLEFVMLAARMDFMMLKDGIDSFIGANSSSDDIVYLRDITFVQIGAVAELRGENATATTWFDVSGNDLHGATSGSPTVTTNNTWGDGRFRGSLDVDGQLSVESPSVINSNAANTSPIITIENTAGDFQIFRTDATPEASVTGSIGDLAIDGTNGIAYLKNTGSASNTGWVTIGGTPTFKSYAIADVGNAGINYLAGYYEAPATSATLTIGGTVTQAYGTAGQMKASYAFVVASGAGGTDLVLTVSGVSITDAGIRNDADSEIIVADADQATTNAYYETQKKWLGEITYTLTGASGAFTFNYGFCKYEDFGNRDFAVTDFELGLLGAASETGFNIELLHHKTTGWTYSAGAFVPGSDAICSSLTDYSSTNDNFVSGSNVAYKRAGLSTSVDGDGMEGVLIRMTTATNNSIRRGTCSIGINIK